MYSQLIQKNHFTDHFTPTPATLKDMCLTHLRKEDKKELRSYPKSLHSQIAPYVLNSYQHAYWFQFDFFTTNYLHSHKEFTLDWLHDVWTYRRGNFANGRWKQSGKMPQIDIRPCSVNWFLYLHKYKFDMDVVFGQNPDNLPWYMPDLGFMLMLDGDIESNPGPGQPMVHIGRDHYQKQVYSLKELALTKLSSDALDYMWNLPSYTSRQLSWHGAQQYQEGRYFEFNFYIDESNCSAKEFTLDWFTECFHYRNSKWVSHEHHEPRKEDRPCSANWYLYLLNHTFNLWHLWHMNPDNLPFYQPDLGFMLLLSGDVEENPGPQNNERLPLEEQLRRRIYALERHRERQQEKQKTLIKKNKFTDKFKGLKYQVNMEDILKMVKNPDVQKATAYAATNMAFPGVGTAAATVIEGGRIMNTSRKLETAAESLADMCSKQVPELLTTHANLAEVATATITNINNLTTHLTSSTGLLATIQNFVKTATTSVSTIALLISVIICLAALAWDWKIGCATIFLVLVYFNWPSEVMEKIKHLIGFTGFRWQADFTDHVPLIGQIVFTLLAFFGVSKIPTERFYDNLLKRMDAVPKAFSGMYKIWENAGKMFDIISDEFKIYFLGAQRDDLVLEKGLTDEVNTWVARVKFFMEAKQRNLLARDEASVKEVEELFTKMYRWKHTPHLWKAFSPECQRVITSITPMVQDLYKFACRSTVHEGGPRKAPLAVFLSGDSGRGKSELLYPLALSLLAHRGCNMENARNEIYVRNYETEYWDGYVGQKIAFFDDAFQIRDTPSSPSPEWMEAIRLINTAPAHVHCADLNDKGRFFSSEICIYTTNLSEKIDNFITSVNCPEAALRRLNANAYRIKTNPLFEKQVIINGQPKMRLDEELIKRCQLCEELRIAKGLEQRLPFCPHAQTFDKYDIITDEILQADMSYADLCRQLKEYDTRLRHKEDDKLFMYEKLMEDPYFFEANDEEVYADCSDQVGVGAIDFASPTDVVAYNSLRNFTHHLTVNCRILDHEVIQSEIAAHAPLWITYQRLVNHGYINQNRRDETLQIALDAAGIGFNHEADIYHSTRNLRYNFKNVYNSFCGYVSKLAQQVVWVWERSGLGELLGFAYLGLAFLALSSIAYTNFTKSECKVCKKEECICVRLTRRGLLHKGVLHPWSADNVMPQFKTESAYDALPKTPQMRMESVYDNIVKTPQMRMEAVYDNIVRTPQMQLETPYDLPRTPVMRMEAPYDLQRTAQIRMENAEGLSFFMENAYPEAPRTEKCRFEAYLDQGCEMLENKIVSNSLYLLHEETKPLGNVLFIRGTVFLMNWHYLELFKRRMTAQTVLYLSNRYGRMMELTFGDIMEHSVRLEKNGQKTDATLVYLDSVKAKCTIHPNIVKHFIKTEDLSNLSGTYRAQVPTYNSHVDSVCISKRSVVDVRMNRNVVKVDDSRYPVEINSSWRYDGSTTPGDCGAPIILNHNSAIRKILGIHMASNATLGVAQTVTQDMINEGLTAIPSKYQMFVDIDLPCDPIVGDEKICGSVPMNAGLAVHGRTKDAAMAGTKTKITPSKFFDYVPHKTIPAKLRADGEIDPMYLGLKKYGKEVPRIEPKLIEIAMNDVKNNFELNDCRKNPDDYRRVLTYEESLMGVAEDEFLAPINRSTSMGYPYALNTKSKGKREAFGEDEWDLNSDLAKKIRLDVEKLIDNARNGIQSGVYWSDTLKDERRPIAKVEAGKTRVFCGGPVHFTLAFRQYFLGFAAWMMHNRNANEVSVGTNVFSPDWNDIVQKLASRALTVKGMNIVAGDFSNFDGSLSSQILWAILEAINEWYDDGEENAQIRRTLWTNIVHAVHINRDIIYQATHSQPSGCPITAILNSIYNSVIIRISFLICAQQQYEKTQVDYRSMHYFNLLVAMVSYGDDNLIGINETILEWFNQETITVALSIIGHEYTDEAKTGIVVPFRNIDEVAYLKRAFKWDPRLNRYIAPLDLSTVLEIAQWTKKGLLSDAITLANLDVTMRELSLHDSSVFDEYKKILQNECRKHKVNYRFLTQDEYLADVCSSPLMLEANQIYTLCKTDKKLPRNYILQDKTSRTLQVNSFDFEILKSKLLLFCHYRHITIKHVRDLPISLVKNICDAPLNEVIVQCISADAKMSAGLAELLQDRYNIRTKLPPLSLHDAVIIENGPRKICCLVTKEKYFMKPTLLDLEKCLEKLDPSLEYAFPHIGCGLDRLKWEEVEPLLNKFPNKTIY